MIVGKRGTGKSLLSISMSLGLDPSVWSLTPEQFISERICKNIQQFITNVQNLKMGRVITQEEAGINIGHRDWQTEYNKLTQKVLQLVRFKRLVLLFNVPNRAFIDKSVRDMFDFQVETSPGIDYDRNVNVCKVTETIISQYKRDTLQRYLRVLKNGRMFMQKTVEFPRPPLEIEEEYIKQSDEYKQQYIQDTLEEVKYKKQMDIDKKTIKPVDYNAIENEIRKDLKYYRNTRIKYPGLSQSAIMSNFDLTTNHAIRIKHKLEKKLREEGIL